MDFPSKEELIANNMDGDLEKLRKFLDVDSIEYLSNEKLHASVPEGNDQFGNTIGYCDACFTGNYPIPIEEIDKAEFDS